MATCSRRPQVKTTYGSRPKTLPSSSPRKRSSAASEWAELMNEDDDDAADSSFTSFSTTATTQSGRSTTPSTSPGSLSSECGMTEIGEDEDRKNEEVVVASTSSPARELRARIAALPKPPKALPKATQQQPSTLHSFFKRASPKKRAFKDDSDDESSTRGRTSSKKPMRISHVPGSKVKLESSKSKGKSKPVTLEQLYLDPFTTAGHNTLSCAVCSLSYTRSPQDLAFHTKHHARVVGGCDWVMVEGNEVSQIESGIEWGDKGQFEGGRIVMVAANAPGKLGQKIKEILQTIDRELSATSLTPSQLAESKLTLFITPQRKVIACAVAQRITSAYMVTPSSCSGPPSGSQDTGLLRFGEQDGAVFCSPTLHPALLGIHRIWTSTSHRRSALASKLLDATSNRYIYGHLIIGDKRKTDMAFSQPTGAGMALARSWTGTESFKVFAD